MSNLWGKLLCAMPKWAGGGCKRGKVHYRGADFKEFRCPRCGATWTRKVGVKP